MPPVLAPDPAGVLAPPPPLLLFEVEPHAARTPPASTADSAATAARRAVRIPVIVLPFGWWMDGLWNAMRSAGLGSCPAAQVLPRPTQRLAAVGHDDADQQQHTGDDVLLVGRDVELDERHLQAADDSHRQHDADDGAAAAEEGHPAEQHDGNDVEFESA